MKVCYVQGKVNVGTDAFSRMHFHANEENTEHQESLAIDEVEYVLSGRYIKQGQDEDQDT